MRVCTILFLAFIIDMFRFRRSSPRHVASPANGPSTAPSSSSGETTRTTATAHGIPHILLPPIAPPTSPGPGPTTCRRLAHPIATSATALLAASRVLTRKMSMGRTATSLSPPQIVKPGNEKVKGTQRRREACRPRQGASTRQ
ncbi:hypothetical protein B0H14DRAFT_2792755 [Mycena olivaceomarginata]|nr:hypothetical protein B0H14DRAFT_2792755 [Mycena olivaceomarginata]